MTDREPVDQTLGTSPAGRVTADHSRRNFLTLTGAAGLSAAATGWAMSPEAYASASTGTAAPLAAKGGRTAAPTFTPIRPPATPLAVRSPYLSTWMATDNLPGTWPTFWTGRITAMAGIAQIDGTAYVFLGNPALPDTNPLPTMRQVNLTVTSTSSVYTLEEAGVRVTVTFFSPVEPGDQRRQSAPLSYVSAAARSVDGTSHQVALHFDISGEWGYGDTSAQITWEQTDIGTGANRLINLNYTPANPSVLSESNDMASWGTMVWTTQHRAGLTYQIGEDNVVRARVVNGGALDNSIDTAKPRAINDRWPVFAFHLDLGSVRAATEPMVISIGHVREPAVSYLTKALAPRWKTYFAAWQDMIAFFHKDWSAATKRAGVLDNQISRDARKAGGTQYAALVATALRQAYAGTEQVTGPDGTAWAFLKEISSDGNMSTVDVTYPCMPVFLYLDPTYLKAILEPILQYAETGGWPKQFAEHDLGAHYPNADGHNDGNEEDMPVEESANMLIMSAAYLQRADVAAARKFATAHYTILKQWSDYLVGNALDPGYQNQTDDFTGFIAHSVNLALKGIVGIGAMSVVATTAGKNSDAAHYLGVARSYIAQWVTKSTDTGGKHLKLAYDQDGTWSLKYNGYADKVLGLGLVPASVAAQEARWYLARAGTYGVPLDIRHTYTKADWEMWTAAWLSDRPKITSRLIQGLYTFGNTTPSRVPFSDWYDTATDRQSGFQARPTVGGFFALLTV